MSLMCSAPSRNNSICAPAGMPIELFVVHEYSNQASQINRKTDDDLFEKLVQSTSKFGVFERTLAAPNSNDLMLLTVDKHPR